MKVNLRKFPNNFSERKLSVEVDYWDTWNADSTIAIILFPLLLSLKNAKQGIPSSFVDGVGSEMDRNFTFDFIDDHDAVFEKQIQNWNIVLDKIIWSFQQLAINQDYADQYRHGKLNFSWKKSDLTYPNPITGAIEPCYEMVDNSPESHWYDMDGHMLHEERIQEGIDLFAKYFRDLWS